MSLVVSPSAVPCVMDPIPHAVREFGVEARKPGRDWEAAFNGPIHPWFDPETQQTVHTVTVRLARLKDPISRELYSTDLLFYLTSDQMTGMHNVYEMARTVPFTRIRGPRTPVPECPPRTDGLWYDANPEGVIMEDVRQTPAVLPNGRPGFFITGQGYRGKVMKPDGTFIHDVGVYGGYLDPQERARQLELTHLFGGIQFVTEKTDSLEDLFLTELGPGIWARGIVGDVVNEIHVESYKNSVRLPCPDKGKVLVGARSMSETKLLHFFESDRPGGLSGFHLSGFIEGLPHAIGDDLWDQVHRVGLGSNFLACPELGGYVGIIHVVWEKNNPAHPGSLDAQHPGIEEQYEGWLVRLDFDERGAPRIRSCVRAVTPDDVPRCYAGAGELFDTKRVAFPMSLYRAGDQLEVAYGWGDRALFQCAFDYETVVRRLAAHTAA